MQKSGRAGCIPARPLPFSAWCERYQSIPAETSTPHSGLNAV